MKKPLSKTARRAGVIVTTLSLIATILLSEVVIRNGSQPWSIIALIVTGMITIVTYIFFFRRTGLWSFVHRDFDKYDEREAQVALNAVRYSYAIFTVIAIAILFIYAVTEIAVNVVLAAGLLGLAHILPTSIIAWSRKNV